MILSFVSGLNSKICDRDNRGALTEKNGFEDPGPSAIDRTNPDFEP